MTLEKFMKILEKNNVQFKRGPNSSRIYIDNDIVVNAKGTAFIKPAKDNTVFHTYGQYSKDLKNVKEDDLKPMIAYYRKLHKYDPLLTVDRIQLCGTELKYVAVNGKTYSIATGMLKALKRDLKKGIEELQGRS